MGLATPARESTLSSKIQRLMAAITEKIISGEWPPGHRLPSGRALAREHQVSMITVRAATERLANAGWVVTAPGSGVYVATRLPAQSDD